MSMRLYSKQIYSLTSDIVRTLTEEKEIIEIAERDPLSELSTEEGDKKNMDAEEVKKYNRDILRQKERVTQGVERYGTENRDFMISEFHQVISDVLRAYVKVDQELTQLARQDVERRKDDPSMIYSEKRRLAKQRNFGMNDDAPNWIVGQLIEQFYHSPSVGEVYAQDREIYETLIPIIRERMSTQQNLQQEVDQRIKRLEKSSENWEDLFFQVNQRLKEKYQLD